MGLLTVTSLEPLSSPFLLASDAAVNTVITTPDVTTPLMSGLSGVGVTGVSMFPEGLRHPFGFASPLRDPGDYYGGRFRVPTSSVSSALYGSFGATATDEEVSTVTQIGMESSYVLGPQGTATGNVTFYPKVNVLVINSKVFSHLSKAQRAQLAKAASATQTWAIANTPDDRKAAAAFCIRGGKIVGDFGRRARRPPPAAQGVIDQIAQHGGNAAVIASIQQIVAKAGPADCHGLLLIPAASDRARSPQVSSANAATIAACMARSCDARSQPTWGPISSSTR